MTGRLYGVICDNTGFLIFLNHAPDPEAACRLATADVARWGALGPFKRSLMGAPKDDGRSWLELSVFDVTGVLEPDLDPISDDESLMCAMDEENFAARLIVEQLS
jgi:hypothetical protein